MQHSIFSFRKKPIRSSSYLLPNRPFIKINASHYAFNDQFWSNNTFDPPPVHVTMKEIHIADVKDKNNYDRGTDDNVFQFHRFLISEIRTQFDKQKY